MLGMTPLACLLIASGAAPMISGANAPGDDPVGPRKRYEVMQIKSGVEIVVKCDGRPTLVRLVGIDTPRMSEDARIDTLSQKQFLHGLIAIGDWVRLEDEDGAPTDGPGPCLAQVYRASDDLWLNRELAEQGYATMSARYTSRAQAVFGAAEARARAAARGMWAPDYADHAVRPTSLPAPKRNRPYARQRVPEPQMANVPVQAPLALPLAAPPSIPIPVNTAIGTWGGTYGYSYGFGGFPTCSPSRSALLFGRGLSGQPLSLAEIQQQMGLFVTASNQQQANVNRFVHQSVAAYPTPPTVVGTAPALSSWTPAGAGNFGMSSPPAFAGGGTGMAGAGHFGGFAHGGAGHH
jgi:endonuclease YncB( thermonuclease family)